MTNYSFTDFESEEQERKLHALICKSLNNPKEDWRGILIACDQNVSSGSFIEKLLSQYADTHPLLIVRHESENAGNPYAGFKVAFADFFFSIYNHSTRADVDVFSKKLKTHFGSAFPLLLEYVPEASILPADDPDTTPRYTLSVENQFFPLIQSLFLFLANYRNNPVILFTNNLQWMDTSSFNLLKYLLQYLPPGKVSWIGAFKEHPFNRTSLFHTVDEFRQQNIDYVELKTLSQDDVEAHPQNSDTIFLHRLEKLSASARKILSVIACIGEYNHTVMVEWLKGDALLLEQRLTEIESTGILKREGSTYTFVTNTFSTIVVKNISAKERSKIHYTIAEILYASGDYELPGEKVRLMVEQFNHAINWVRTNNEQQQCAHLNYLAGIYSKQQNELSKAQYFFNLSADLLKECKWDQVSEQGYLVYMERARLEYQLGEYDLAEIQLDYLIEHLKDAIKRATVYELKVVINNRLGRYRKSALILKEGLQELGLNMPLDEDAINEKVKLLKDRLTLSDYNKNLIISEENIVKQKAILKLLYVGGMSLHHTSDALMTWGALQIIHRAGKGVASGEKAIGYVVYGRVKMIAGKIDKGYEFGLKALQLNASLNDISLRCRVYGIFAFFISPWKKPFAESNRFLKEAFDAGTQADDSIGCYVIKTHQLNFHLLAGLPLHEIVSLAVEETHPETELTYYITHYQRNLIKFLIGESTIFSIPRLQPSWLAATNTIQEEKFYRNYAWARYYFIFGYYELAEDAACHANENRKLQEGSPLIPANYMIWFLSITQNWFNYSIDRRATLKPVLQKIASQMELWYTHSPENYESCWWLLNGELERIKSNDTDVVHYYSSALETAGANRWYKAITAECCAKFLLTIPEKKTLAVDYLHQAQEYYKQWGATVKVAHLSQQYRAVLPGGKVSEHDINMEMIQHELSGDLEVGSLVKKLMILCLRISGSTGVVVESVEGNGLLKRLGKYALLPSHPTEEKEDEVNPGTKILQAYRSQQIIVVNDVDPPNGYSENLNYTHHQSHVKSYLILPVTIRDHLSFVIYMENIFASHVYSTEIIKWLKITANQGAVIIENARIHEVTLKLNEDIRQKMEEKERLSAEIKKQKDIHLQALEQTQNNERKRIAGDLHDSLGSILSSVKLRFNSLQDDFITSLPAKASRFKDTIKLLDDAVHELRRIVYDMLPISLNRFGLPATLQTFVEQINEAEQLDVELQILGLEERLNDELEMGLYRICQELVQNVIKHAEATSMRIQIIHHQDAINLIVEDNGKGMNKDEIKEGLGFITIQSKVSVFKGNFTIESQPGKGTMVLIDIPDHTEIV